MIARLRGAVESIEDEALIVSLGGVGIRVRVPAGVLQSVAGAGAEVSLHTYLYVREAELTLYGFSDSGGLKAFEALLAVGGVGPRVALSVLSGMDQTALAQCVELGDVEPLTRVPGVGRKTAQRIVLELRGKFGTATGTSTLAPLGAGAADEAVLALTALGYSSGEALRALQASGLPATAPVEARITAALKALAG